MTPFPNTKCRVGVSHGDEHNSSGKVGSMGRRDTVRQEDGWGHGDERNSLGEVDGMGRGTGKLDSRTR